MTKDRKLVIFGFTEFAQIACEYFTVDTPYAVVGFCAHAAFREVDELMGLPVVDFEEIERHFEPAAHSFFAASVYTRLNRLRTAVKDQAKAKGFALASYISPRAFVWRNVELGEHVFVFEDNTLQPFVRVADNVVLWSGNHVGHHSVVEENCFVSSHVVISGGCRIGANTFMGVNATVNNGITIGRDCLIGSGALIYRDVPADSLVKGSKPEEGRSARAHFGVAEEEVV